MKALNQYARDQKTAMLERDSYRCRFCEIPTPGHERGHVIKQSKLNRRLFGDQFIDHAANNITTCGRKDHNARAEVGELDSPERHRHIIGVFQACKDDGSLPDGKIYPEECRSIEWLFRNGLDTRGEIWHGRE